MLELIDETNCEIQFKLWGDPCNMSGLDVGNILAIKNVYITEYRTQKQLSMIRDTQILINP